MRLLQLTADAAPPGNRVVLAWRPPDPGGPAGVRVVRRLGAFPVTPTPDTDEAGVVVVDSDAGGPGELELLDDGRLSVVDAGLAEGVHYYQVFPRTGPGAVFDLDPSNRVAVAATAPYGFAERMWRLVPAIYHRYDTATPQAVLDPTVVARMAADDRAVGQLRRFLELPGSQLDALHSDIRSLLDLHDLRRVDGRLLPLLADWIGWSTDHRLGYDRQRAEIRGAPALYRAVGTVPALEATAMRIAEWPSRTKEFVDNVFRTGAPERRTLWLAGLDAGAWTLPEQPLSLDAAPSGVTVAVRESTGSVLLVYPTWRPGRHEIRVKRHDVDEGWQPSEPVVSRGQVDRDPAAARQGSTTWVFWTVHDPGTGSWRIDWRTGRPGSWSPVTTFRTDPGDSTARRAPAAAVDDDGALWLFWSERADGGWRLRYARFADDPWQPTPVAAVDFPLDPSVDPRVESDVTVVTRAAQPGDPGPAFRRLGVLWAYRAPVTGEPGQTRWRTAARFKDDLDPALVADWGPVRTLPVDDEHAHDREPAAHVAPDGTVSVFLASTRGGGWSLRTAELRLDPLEWGDVEALPGTPFSERAPLPLALAPGGPLDALCFRSNRSLTSASTRYRATTTTDRRWSGSTTVRSSDSVKLGLRGSYDDHATYTYDTRRGDGHWYARDTVGLYVAASSAAGAGTAVDRERLQRVLPEFAPATDRVLVIAEDPGS